MGQDCGTLKGGIERPTTPARRLAWAVCVTHSFCNRHEFNWEDPREAALLAACWALFQNSHLIRQALLLLATPAVVTRVSSFLSVPFSPLWFGGRVSILPNKSLDSALDEYALNRSLNSRQKMKKLWIQEVEKMGAGAVWDWGNDLDRSLWSSVLFPCPHSHRHLLAQARSR